MIEIRNCRGISSLVFGHWSLFSFTTLEWQKSRSSYFLHFLMKGWLKFATLANEVTRPLDAAR